MEIKPLNMHIRYILMVVGVEITLSLGLVVAWEGGWILRGVILSMIVYLLVFPIKLYKKKGPRGFAELKECNSEMLNSIVQFRKDDLETDVFIKKCLALNGYIDEGNFQRAKKIYERNVEKKFRTEARKSAYKIVEE
jgi:hypothetical protein